MWTGIIDNNSSKWKKKPNGIEAIEEALDKLDNEQDVQEILSFINITLDKREKFRKTLELVSKIKDCAKELSKISPDLTFYVSDCYENQTVAIDFQELYDALNERF